MKDSVTLELFQCHFVTNNFPSLYNLMATRNRLVATSGGRMFTKHGAIIRRRVGTHVPCRQWGIDRSNLRVGPQARALAQGSNCCNHRSADYGVNVNTWWSLGLGRRHNQHRHTPLWLSSVPVLFVAPGNVLSLVDIES